MSLLATSTCIAQEDKGCNSGQTVSQHCVPTASERYFSRGDLGLIPGSGLRSSSKRAVPKPNGSSKKTGPYDIRREQCAPKPNKQTSHNLVFMHMCHTSADRKSTLGPTAARTKVLSPLSLLCLMWMCSHRAPRTKVSMWITSTARCAVCRIVRISLLNFFRREPWGFGSRFRESCSRSKACHVLSSLSREFRALG